MRRISMWVAASALFGALSAQASPVGGVVGSVGGIASGVPVVGGALNGVVVGVGGTDVDWVGTMEVEWSVDTELPAAP